MTRFALALIFTASAHGFGELTVIDVAPPANATTAPVDASITVTFDRSVDPASVDEASFRVFGRWSGAAAGTFELSPDGMSVTLEPDAPFSAGERVLVVLSHDLAALDGSTLRPAGYAWHFWTAAAPAPRDYTEIANMTTRSDPKISTRSYGGIGSDLNGDRFLDLTVVNEDTADLRVFLNLAAGDGLFAPFAEPTYPVEDRASPSEPADFDGDGHVDICVANINANSVSILLGVGDGSFGPQQIVAVGGDPRGIAALDVDGDGDPDIVNTNASSGNMSLLVNDGAGVFGAATFFEGGGAGEWSLDAADMDEDGIMDLVIGARNSQEILVNRGNGDGTFSLAGTQSAGGATWMLAVGDVNGDGHVDVSTANSSSNNGAILLGDGAGGLAPPAIHATDPFPLATDLGDLDGDGDLDWAISSFSGDWWLFANDGSGGFAFDQEIDAPQAASCALVLDVDNDGDTDLALIDELADVVLVLRNGEPALIGDVDGDGVVGVDDLLVLLASWGPCGGCPADLDGDGQVGVDDLLLVLANWS